MRRYCSTDHANNNDTEPLKGKKKTVNAVNTELGRDTVLNEWSLHGVSTKIDNYVDPAKYLGMTDLHIAIHISRSAGYYFWKALLPLYLLTIVSFTTFEFEVDDLSSRNDTVSTHFLAAFAMLYVVGASLPRTDFLTKIDIVIVLTTTLLVIIGITSVVVHRVAKKDDAALAMAEKWNTRIEVGLLALYATINIINNLSL